MNPATEHDVDVDPETSPSSLALRSTSVPVTLVDLAARQGEAVQIIEARVQVLNTARTHAMKMTHPEDWVLFKSKDDRITGYLEDAGCERVRPIFGISIFAVEEPVKVTAQDGKSFAIIVRGCGRSSLTLDKVEGAEGVRESTEDFCKDLSGVKQEIRVRQAARANLDGRIVRELAGLGQVPLEELELAWAGSSKKASNCRKGRGFGTQDERLGATRQGEPDVEPPTCPHCQPPNTVKLKFRPGKDGRASFYGCPNWDKHKDKKVIVDADKWVADRKAEAAAAGTTAKPTDREPGAEG